MLLDKRKYQGPEKTPDEMIKILPAEKYEEALVFINLGNELNCKTQTRYAHANKYWRCVFSVNKPRRVLFTVECTDEWWRVKAMLSNIEQYKDRVMDCSENLVCLIKNAYDCHKCSGHCKGPKPFVLDNIEYRKCIGCSFYFSDLPDEDMQSLVRLIKEEAKY